MLAGIVISLVVLVGLAVAIPWLVAHRDTPDPVDNDISERFSDSMRIVRGDVNLYAEMHDEVEISTPLIRRAELTELKLLARSAARRRARTAGILVFLLLVATGLAAFNITPWWGLAIPGALLAAFLVASPIMVRAMNRRFDARAQRVMEGYTEDELTETIHLDEPEESITIDVDLSAPQVTGSLWDPIPVTAPTYVSKPLAPRTVRTIDLSAPVVATEAFVPTADHPERDVESIELQDTEVLQRPRAVGE